MATKAQIQVSVTGFKQLQNLQASVKNLAPQIDKANAAFIRLSGASKQTLPIVANLREELEKSKRAFQASVLGTKAAVDAAKTQVNAERLLNNELERRNKLLNQVRATPVEKSIARNEAKPKKFQTGFTAFSQDVSKQAQERLIQQKKEELAVTEAIARAENRRLNALAEQVVQRNRDKVSGRIEIQRVTNPKFAGGGSSGSTIRSMDRTGFAAFSKRASEIEKTTKAEIALSKSRTAAAQKLKSLESIEKRRAQTQSFGANLRRFRRGRTAEDRAVRGRVASSAFVGGGFPLLFGGGPISALAGGLGGGIGELFGKGGGFAGSIAATAIAQTIQQAVTAISELGQALGPFTQDTQAATTAMGLQGSAQEAQLKRIERTQGKTAAFNAAMKMMENRIEESGVRKIKEFGETTRILGTIFSTALLRLQAFAAGVVDFVAKLLAGEKKLKEAEINQVVADAAAGGNKEAQALLNRQTEIEETGFRKTSRGLKAKPGTQGKIDELNKDKEIFAIRNKISLANDEITSKSKTLLEDKRKEFELNQKIEELVKGGMNPALAKSLATVEQTFDEEQKILEQKALQAEENLRKAIADEKDLEIQKLLKNEFIAHTRELGEHNKLRKDAIDLTKQLNDETDKFAQSLEGPIKEGIKGLIKGTSTLGDLLNKVADKFLDLAIDEAFGSFGGGGIFGFLGNIFKANGGPVAGGNPYIVGEKGPELFVPRSSGTIVPNNQLGGGSSTSVVVNVDASGTSAEGDEPDAAQLGRLIGSVVQAELIKESRPGGLLSSTR